MRALRRRGGQLHHRRTRAEQGVERLWFDGRRGVALTAAGADRLRCRGQVRRGGQELDERLRFPDPGATWSGGRSHDPATGVRMRVPFESQSVERVGAEYLLVSGEGQQPAAADYGRAGKRCTRCRRRPNDRPPGTAAGHAPIARSARSSTCLRSPIRSRRLPRQSSISAPRRRATCSRRASACATRRRRRHHALERLAALGSGFSIYGAPSLPYIVAPGSNVDFLVRFTAPSSGSLQRQPARQRAQRTSAGCLAAGSPGGHASTGRQSPPARPSTSARSNAAPGPPGPSLCRTLRPRLSA